MATTMGESGKQAVNGSRLRKGVHRDRILPRPRTLTMTLAALFGAGAAHAAPGIVTTGQTATSLHTLGNVTNITTSTVSGNTALNAFKTFDVSKSQVVNLVVPGSTKNLINLVYDQAIDIDGTVNSLKDGRIGGNVIFADPHGMIVGASGVLNVGSLTALTPTKQFMDGVIGVDGTVSQTAISQMLAGDTDTSAQGLIRIDGIVNAAHSIRVRAAKVNVGGTLNAGADALQEAAFMASVNTSRLKQATGMVDNGGEIDIVGTQSTTIAGTLDAKSSATVGTGGNIDVTGNAVHVTRSADIDASGANGGGRIDIGVSGSGASQELASTTAVDDGAVIRADATVDGDGGNIRVWGQNANAAGGSYSAQGGAQAGDGGTVELSADTGLAITAKVDTRAAAGKTGMLVIDPEALDIVNDGDSSDTDAGVTTMTVGQLQGMGDTNITLAATGTLTIGDSTTQTATDLDLSGTLLTSANTLSLSGATVNVLAGSSILTGGGSVSVAAQNITVGAGATIDTTTAAATAGRTGGNITLAASDTVDNETSVASEADADASVDVYGTLKGADVSLTATANATNDNTNASATGIYNDVSAANASTDSSVSVLPASLLFNGADAGVMIANATATVEVHSGADVEAAGALTLDANATQATTLAYTVGGKDANGNEDSNVATALIYAGIEGGASALIDSGATVSTGGALTVKASDTSSLTAKVTTQSSSGSGGITGLIGYSDLDVDAAIASGASVTTAANQDVTVAAIHNGSVSLTAASNSDADANATVGVAVAIADIDDTVAANLGANLGSSASPVGNVVVQATNALSTNSVNASTSVSTNKTQTSSASEATLSGVDNTSLYGFLSNLLSSESDTADTSAASETGQTADNSSPFKLGGALSLSIDNIAASAAIAAGTTIDASGSVGVIAQVSDADIHNSASSGLASATTAGSNPSADGSLSAGMALGFYTHTASATIGPNVTITAANVAVDSDVSQPYDPLQGALSGFSWTDLSSYEDLAGVLKTIAANPSVLLTSYANASGSATDGSVSGAVSYLDVGNNSTAWVGENSSITTTGGDSFAVSLLGADGATATPTALNFTHAVSIDATTLTQVVTDAGNMAIVAGAPVAPGGTTAGNVAVGGSGSVVDYENTTIAGVDDGVSIQTITGTSVGVNAASTDFSVAISPSSGSGSPIGVNGTVGITLYDNRTAAEVSDTADITTTSLDVDADEDLSTWTIGGALVTGNQTAVGVGVAVNDIDTDTFAGIAPIDAGDRPDDMTSSTASTDTPGVTATNVAVDATTDGEAYALSVAGTKSSASQSSGSGTSSASTPDADSNSPSTIQTLLANAAGVDGLIGSTAAGAVSALSGLYGAYQKVSTLLSSSDSTPTPTQEPGFGLTVSGSSSVNMSSLSTQAVMDDATVKSASGGTVAVQAENDSDLISASGAAALTIASASGGSSSSAALAGAVAIEDEDNLTQARIEDGSSISGASNLAVQALSTGEHLGIGLGIGVNSKNADATAVAGSVSLALLTNTTDAEIDGSTVVDNAGSTAQILADDSTQVGVGGGSLALGGSTGVGLALTFVESSSNVTAEIDNSAISGVGDLSLWAFDPTLIMAGALEATATSPSAEDSTALGGSFVFNDVANQDTAAVLNSNVTLSGSLSALASDDPASLGLDPSTLSTQAVTNSDGTAVYDFNASLLAGQSAPEGAAIYGVAGAVDAGTTAIGIAYVDNEIENSHTVEIGPGSSVSAASAALQAQDASSILGIAAGVGVSTGDGGFAGIGSATVNIIDNTVAASVQGAAGSATTVTSAGEVTISAANTATIESLAGSVSVALEDSPSVGLAVAYNQTDGNVSAEVVDAVIDAASQGVTVTAADVDTIETEAASVAGTTGSLALAGSVSINDIGDTTQALIEGGSDITGSLTVQAGDDDAGTDASIESLAGGFALTTGTAAVGAGVAVNTIDSTYLAEVDDATVTLPASGVLDVAATDSASIYTAAIGGALGDDAAAAVSETVNDLDGSVTADTTDATIVSTGSGSSAATETVAAASTAKISALAGAIGVTPSGLGIGVASAVNQIDNTIAATVSGGTADVAALTVDAQSDAEINSLAVGAAVSTGVASVAGSIAVNLIGTDVTATIGDDATVSAYGSAGILADDDDTVRSIAGAASVSVGGDATLSAGASTAINQITGTTQATIDDASVTALANGSGVAVPTGDTAVASDLNDVEGYTAPTAADNSMGDFLDTRSDASTQTLYGVVVDANGSRVIDSIAATGAVTVNPDILDPSIALAATVTTNEIGGTTEASIDDALINQSGTANAAQAVNVLATSHAQTQSVVGALAAALWGGAGAAVDTETFTLQTLASIDSGSEVTSANATRVIADSVFDVDAIAAGFSAGGVAAIGTGELSNFNGMTQASVDDATLDAASLAVDADSQDTASLVAGGGAVGAVGLSGSYAVVDSTQTTQADIDNNATVTAAGAVGVSADAATGSTLYSVSGALADDTGVGTSAGVALIQNTTTAEIAGSSTVDAGGDLTVTASDTGTLDLTAGALGVGFSGVGAGATAAVSVVRSNVLAQIDNADVSAADVTLAATNNQDIEHDVVAVGVGGVAGLSGVASVVLLGNGEDSSDDNTGSATDLLTDVGGFASSDKMGDTGTALTSDQQASLAQGTEVSNLGAGTLADSSGTTASGGAALMSGPANSAHAYIDGDASVTATAGNVSLTGLSETHIANDVGSLAVGGALGIGVGVAVTHVYDDDGAVVGPDATVTAAQDLSASATAENGSGGSAIDDLIAAGAAGAVGVTVNVGDEDIDDQVIADVGGSASAGSAIGVSAADTSSIDATNAAGSLGLAGVGAVVLTAEKTGLVQAGLNADAADVTISAPDVSITADSSGGVDTATYAVEGGLLLAAGGNSANSTDSQNVTAQIGANTDVDATDAVSVDATRSADVSAYGYGVGVGGEVQVGISTADASVSGATQALVGNQVIFSGEADSDTQFATLDVEADNDVTASASATASGGGVLVGLNGADAQASNTTSVTAAIGNDVVLPMSNVTVNADGNSTQTANAQGISVGIVGVGTDIADASSNTSTLAQMGSGVMSAVLEDGGATSAADQVALRGGDLAITTGGTDTNDATASSGAGGLVAGAAAEAGTQTEGTSIAQVLDGLIADNAYLNDVTGAVTLVAAALGAASPLQVGSYTLSANHTSNFMSEANATQASIAGDSGANATGDVSFETLAYQGANTGVEATNIAIDALNTVTHNGANTESADGVSGGLGAGAGVSSTNTIDVTSEADVGSGAALTVTGDPLDSTHGRFSLIAANSVSATDDATVTAGGAVSGATSDSSTTVDATANVNVDSDASIYSVGDMDIGTYNIVDLSNGAYAHAYGLAGGAGGEAASDIVSNQNIDIDAGSMLTSWGNMSIATGRGDQGALGTDLLATASDLVYFDGAFDGVDPDGEASIVNNGNLNIASGVVLNSVRDILLGNLAGSTSVSATGQGDYTILGIPFSTSHANSSNTGALATVMDGAATAGTNHDVELDIGSDGAATTDTNVTFGVSSDYAPVAQLEAQVAALQDILSTTTDTTDAAEISADIDALNTLIETLEGRGVSGSTTVTAIDVSDTMAAGGNITIDTGSYSGAGSLTAYGGPTITINNASSDYLLLNELYIPNELGGEVEFTGTGKASSSYLASNVHEIDTDAAASITINNTGEGSNGLAPAIYLTGTIENLGGALSIYNEYGDLAQFGSVSTNSINVLVPNGAYIVDTPTDGYFLGGDPESQYVAPGGQAYVLTPTSQLASDTSGFALPSDSDPDEAVTYVVNYLAQNGLLSGVSCSSATSAAALGGCLAGNPPSGDASGQSGTGWMFFYPGNQYASKGGASPGSYTSVYGGDIGFYDGRYEYPSVGVRATSVTIANLSPANDSSSSVTQVGQAAVINAKYVDMNGTLKVGQYTDYSATIADNSALTTFLQCVASAACSTTLTETADGLYALPAGIVTTDASADTPITVYYNPATGGLVLDQVSGGGGGTVSITGAVINTSESGGPNIVVNDGYADVTVDNETGLTLTTQDISTGNDNVGVVKVTDTLKTDGAGDPLTTWYVYRLGSGTQTYASYTATDYTDLTPQASTTTGSVAYDPLTGERYTWTYTADLSRTVTQPLSGGDWTTLRLSDWSYDTLPSNTAGTYDNIWTITTGLSNNTSLENDDFNETITGSESGNAGGGVGYSYNGPLSWNWIIPTSVSISATGSVKADNPINISFQGTNTSGTVDVASVGSVVVGGNIQNISGNTSISATGTGSTITGTSNGVINTQSLTLNADSGIGSLSAPLQVSMTNPAGASGNANVVSAITRTGDIGLSFTGSTGALLEAISTDANNDVSLTAVGDLLGDSTTGAVITGRNVTLTSTDGSIGSSSTDPLIIQPESTTTDGITTGGVVNASAYGDVYLEQPTGDFEVGSIVSTGGTAWVKAETGSIVDGSGVSTSNKTAQLASVWEDLNLEDTRTGAAAGDITQSAAYTSVVLPYEQSINSQYTQYWTLAALGSVSDDGTTFTLNGTGQSMLAAQAQAAGETVQAYAQAEFTALTSALNTALSTTNPTWQSSYDSAFNFQASTAQIDAMTAGQYWTADDLLYAINSAALQPVSSTATAVSHVNVSGVNVTLLANEASVGSLGDSVSFDLSSGSLSDLTTAQEAALASANSAGDVIDQVYERDVNGSYVVDSTCTAADTSCRLVSFDIKETNPLYVQASGQTDATAASGMTGGLTATAGDDVYVQAAGTLPIVSVSAGEDAQITSETGMVNTAAGNVAAITAGGDLDLENGSGSIGSAAAPMTLNVAGVLESARSGEGSTGDLYLAALTGNLSFDDLYASRLISLTTEDTAAGQGNIYSLNTVGGSSVASISAQYLSLNTTGSVYGTTPATALVVTLTDGGVDGGLSGTVDGSLDLTDTDALEAGRLAVAASGGSAALAAQTLYVKGNATLDSSAAAPEVDFVGATDVAGTLTLDDLALNVGFGAQSTVQAANMNVDVDALAMQAGSQASIGGVSNWITQAGDMTLGYVSGPDLNFSSVSGSILGAADSPIDNGENIYSTGTVTLNGGMAGALVDGAGIGSSAAAPLTIAAANVDASTASGDIYLDLVGSAALTSQSVSAKTVAGDIDVASSVDFTAQSLTSDATNDITLSTTGSATMTLEDVDSGQDVFLNTVDGGVDIAAGGNVTVTRDLHVTMTGDGVMQDDSSNELTAGRDIIMNAAAIDLNNAHAVRNLALTARTGYIDYGTLTTGTGAVTANAATSITANTGGGGIDAASDISLTAGTGIDTTASAQTAADDVTMMATGGTLTYGAVTAATGQIDLAAGANIDASASSTGLLAGSDISLTAGQSIDTSASVVNAAADVTAIATTGQIRYAALTATNGAVSLTAAADIDSLASGTGLNAGTDVTLAAGTDIDTASSKVTAGAAFDVTAQAINVGAAQAGTTMLLTATGGDLDYAGLTTTTGDITLDASNDIAASRGGAGIDAGDSASLTAGQSLDTTGSAVTAANDVTENATTGQIQYAALTATAGNALLTAGAGIDAVAPGTGLIAGQGVTLTADGNIDTAASDVAAGGSFDATALAVNVGTAQAGTTMLVTATDGDIDYGSLTTTAGDITLQASHDIRASGSAAGLNAGESVSLTGGQDIDTSASAVTATDDVTENATAGRIQYAALTAAKGTASLTAGTDIDAVASGTGLTAGQDITLAADGDIDTTASDATAGDAFDATALAINVGTAQAGTTMLVKATGGDIDYGSLTTTAGDITLNASGDITASSGGIGIDAGDSASLAAGQSIDSSDSAVAAVSDVSEDATAGTIRYAALTASDGTASLTAGADIDAVASSAGLTAGTDMSLTAGEDIDTSASALTAAHDVTENATAGTIRYAALTATGGTASLTAGADIDAVASSTGLTAGQGVTLTAGDDIDTRASPVTAGTAFAATAQAIDIGTAQAGTTMLLTATGGDLDYADLTTTAGDITLNASDDITATGAGAGINAGDNASLTAGRDIDTTASDVVAVGTVNGTASAAMAVGNVQAGQAIALTANGGDIDYASLTTSAGGATLQAADDVTASAGGNGIDAAGDVAMTAAAGDIDASASAVTATGSVGMQALGAISTAAVDAADDVTMASMAGDILANALIKAGQDLRMIATGGGARYTSLQAGDDVTVTVGDDLRATTPGVISAGNDVVLATGGSAVFDDVTAGRDATIDSGANIVGNALSANQDIVLNAGGYVRIGSIYAGRQFTLQNASSFTVGTLTAQDVSLSAPGALTLGTLYLGSNLTVVASALAANIVAQGSAPLSLDLRGYNGAYANQITLDVTAPGGVEFSRLWAENATMTAIANQIAILDGRIGEVMRLNTPSGLTLMNNIDASGSGAASLQLYSANQPFTLYETGREFVTSALVTNFAPNFRDSVAAINGFAPYGVIDVFNNSVIRELESVTAVLMQAAQVQPGQTPGQPHKDQAPQAPTPFVHGTRRDGGDGALQGGIVNVSI